MIVEMGLVFEIESMMRGMFVRFVTTVDGSGPQLRNSSIIYANNMESAATQLARASFDRTA